MEWADVLYFAPLYASRAQHSMKLLYSMYLDTDGRQIKGRLLGRGVVTKNCGGDTYLVKDADGRLKMKRQYDLKGIG